MIVVVLVVVVVVVIVEVVAVVVDIFQLHLTLRFVSQRRPTVDFI